MHVTPYLAFDGSCEDAMRFYAACLGGEVAMLVRYRDSPMKEQMQPDALDRVMHARLVAGDVVLMASDCPPGMAEPMQGMSVSLMLEDAAEADRIFAGLSEGATVRMPIGETFWAVRFGMLVDRFGTPWMVNVERPPSG